MERQRDAYSSKIDQWITDDHIIIPLAANWQRIAKSGERCAASTCDIEELKKDFDAHGYCLIADALSPDQVAALKGALFAAREENFQTAFRELGASEPVTVDGLNRRDFFEPARGLEDYAQVAAGPHT